MPRDYLEKIIASFRRDSQAASSGFFKGQLLCREAYERLADGVERPRAGSTASRILDIVLGMRGRGCAELYDYQLVLFGCPSGLQLP